MEPLGDAETFAAMLAEMVADQAPRVFAVVQEYGDRLDGRIAAWGMAFDESVAVFGTNGNMFVGAESPEAVMDRFGAGGRVTPRVVWASR